MRVIEVVAAVLEVAPEEIDDSSARGDASGWTSLRHLQIIAALEEVFGVEFTVDEMVSMKTVGAIRGALQARGKDA